MPRLPVFDAHLHIIDPRFPLVANQGYLPPAFTCADYRVQTEPLGVAGGAVVSGSFQGFDQGYLLDALRQLGSGYVGVTQLPESVTDAEILALDRAGVRAVRFNVRRGGSADLQDLERLAARVHALAGWHIELYIDSVDLAVLDARLRRLPALSIDHLGLSRAGFPALLRLVEHGARVKATGFGRVDLDVRQALREIAAINPDALLFGTDLPSTRAPRPFSSADLGLVQETLGEPLARRVLFENALAFYRPRVLPSA
jgi:predicted TIM-barrel fold metal-dependent hydrolase